jgi:hypothetical protein
MEPDQIHPHSKDDSGQYVESPARFLELPHAPRLHHARSESKKAQIDNEALPLRLPIDMRVLSSGRLGKQGIG